MNRMVIFLKGLIMFALPFVLVGCSLTPTPLPTKTPFMLTELPEGAMELSFETMVQDYHSAYRDEQTRLVVVSEPHQGQEFEATIYPGPQGPPLFERVDFTGYFVIIALHGYRPMCCPHVEIRQIVRKGNQVDMYGYFTDTAPGAPRPATAVSPLHVVKVRKDGEWGMEFTFTLYDNDRQVTETKHYIP